MLLLSASSIEKSYGETTLFSSVSLEIHTGDKIGLVGPNASGKSTLLSILYGSLAPDSGTVFRYSPVSMADQFGHSDSVASGQMRSKFSVRSHSKSGGETTRLALASIFSEQSPLLLLDEPTNNLDLDGIKLVTNQLVSFDGALVVISHDQTLLDQVCTTIWALEHGTVYISSGNYTQYLENRQRRYVHAIEEYQHYQQEKQRLTAQSRQIKEKAKSTNKPPKQMSSSEWLLHKNKYQGKQKAVQARAKIIDARLQQLEHKEKPKALPEVKITLGTAVPLVSKTALTVNGLSICYGKRQVLKDASLILPTGSKTVLLGANGTGKTSLIRQLVENNNPAVQPAPNLKIGYFSQNHDVLDDHQSILDNVWESACLPEHAVRTILARLGFSGEMVLRSTAGLSGGERAKVSLARLFASDSNLLILDEPTNHIDMQALQALAPLFEQWHGTMLLVTHNEQLIRQTADRLLLIENQTVITFAGSYAQYLHTKAHPPHKADAQMQSLLEQMRRAADAAQSG